MQQEKRNQQDTIETIYENFEVQRGESIKKIEDIGESVNAAKLFISVAINMIFMPAECARESVYGAVTAKIELLAYHLYPLFGISNICQISPLHTNECIDALEKLFVANAWIQMRKSEEKRDDTVGDITRYVESQARIVRGSAYPEQTSKEIEDIQGAYESWFSERLGIGPIRAKDILWGIVRNQEDKLNSNLADIMEHSKELGSTWEEAKKRGAKTREEHLLLRVCRDKKISEIFGYVARLNEIAPAAATVMLDDLSNMDHAPTFKEWESLIKLIGLTTEQRKKMSDSVDVRQRPLFVLPGNRVLLVDISNALDVIWDRFEVAIKSENKIYQKYQKKKSEWLEEKVGNSLSKIFPPKNIYMNLAYPDPDKDIGSVAEIDSIVNWGPFLVLVEAKAKQFRTESQLGDAGRLRSDIKANIEDAFEQGRRAARSLSE